MVYITVNKEERQVLWRAAKAVLAAKHPTALEKYKLDGVSMVLRDYEGFLGECAVAKFLGLPYEVKVYENKGDEGVDLTYGSTRIGVKSSTHPKPSLLVKQREKKSDVYFLVKLCKDTGDIDIAGWLDIETILARPTRKVHPNGPMNHVFKYHELNSMDDWVANEQ